MSLDDRLVFTTVLHSLTSLEQEDVRATTKGALEMILKCYPLSTNRDSCLYFREIKVTSKYFFEAVVGLEQIRR